MTDIEDLELTIIALQVYPIEPNIIKDMLKKLRNINKQLEKVSRVELPVKPADCELYWKHRCEAVEDFVRKSPGDPDVYGDQMKAYVYWKKICDIKPEDYLSKLSV